MMNHLFSHVGILSKKFHNEYDGEFLILKRWHFPVYCPDCEVIYNKLEDLTEAPIWFGTTEVCPACATTMILNYEEPKPITQTDVDRFYAPEPPSRLTFKFGFLELFFSPFARLFKWWNDP